ncbi:MAG TPA: phosphoglycerate mutase [Rhodanobacteraceae bacterium]|nr:phosphoglycerate mutase [Rhodanobacteraceae bacterium]
MSTLHVLMPPIAHAEAHPAFHHWLARGDHLADVRDGRVTALRGHFRFAGEGIPAAALRHHCHAGDAGGGNWLCADPAYVRSEATGARLMACPVSDLSDSDAEALAATLCPLLSEVGALQADTPAEWCVRLANGVQPATFTDPDNALGASLIEVLPEGDTARAWRRLFNEIQVALHAHPVNAARVAAHKLPVNALWFWGAGALPDSVDTSLALVASADDVVRGLAKLAGAIRVEPLPEALESTDVRGEALLDLQRLGDRESATEWLTTFERWLRRRRFDAIALTFAGGERCRMRHAHRLRFWRRG